MIDKEQKAYTYPKHDCNAWNHEHWCSQPGAIYVKCEICGKITGFHYRSFWKRFLALFNFSPTKPIRINKKPMRKFKILSLKEIEKMTSDEISDYAMSLMSWHDEYCHQIDLICEEKANKEMEGKNG